jgi:uncharacterized protein
MDLTVGDTRPDGHLASGAQASLAAVHEFGGQVVVAAKHGRRVTGAHDAGLPVDAVVDDLLSAELAALTENGACVVVGDHALGVALARRAGVAAVAVATGQYSRAELAAAGADVVIDDLTEFPAWLGGHVLEVRLAYLTTHLAELGSILVAFSGGADSALVLAAAVRVLGPERVVAATAVSGSLPAAEREQARQYASDLGVQYVEAETHELEREGYRLNAGDRCYFCKAELVDVLNPIALGLGLAAVATGTNADDAGAGFRPGIRAAAQRQAVTPLLDAGLTKAQVRELSRQWGLPTWDKPAAACLSSRIAYGIEVTPERLARVERAELAVRSALDRLARPVRQLRVRDLGGVGRVELDAGCLAAVHTDPAAQGALLDAVRGSGFESAVIDPAGFRSGSMNELLADPARYR